MPRVEDCAALIEDVRTLLATLGGGKTFWIDYFEGHSEAAGEEVERTRCTLERLALAVMHHHAPRDGNSCRRVRGVGWWVQSRSFPGGNPSLGLHFDSDEELKNATGEHAPPWLATVTYLGSRGAPTVVLPVIGDEDGRALLPVSASHKDTGDSSPDALSSPSFRGAYVSHPVAGRHLSFDGRLLHGVLSQLGTRCCDPADPYVRCTLLVNIWCDHRPCTAIRLPASVAALLSDLPNAIRFDTATRVVAGSCGAVAVTAGEVVGNGDHGGDGGADWEDFEVGFIPQRSLRIAYPEWRSMAGFPFAHSKIEFQHLPSPPIVRLVPPSAQPSPPLAQPSSLSLLTTSQPRESTRQAAFLHAPRVQMRLVQKPYSRMRENAAAVASSRAATVVAATAVATPLAVDAMASDSAMAEKTIVMGTAAAATAAAAAVAVATAAAVAAAAAAAAEAAAAAAAITVAAAAVAPTVGLHPTDFSHQHESISPHRCSQSGDDTASGATASPVQGEFTDTTVSAATEAGYNGPESVFTQALQRMPDAARECIEGQPGTDLAALCEGLGREYPTENALDVLGQRQVLNAKECAALRAAVDANPSCLPDSVDRMPEHQLDLSKSDLADLIGVDAVTRLWLLPKRLFAQRVTGIPYESSDNESNDSRDSDEPAGPSWINPEPKYRTEIFVRRYSDSTRPWIGFHRDACAVTVNVSLGNDEEHKGGRLLVALDEGIQVLVRGMGDVTVHPSYVLHAVSAMKRGVRHSLLIFFYHTVEKKPKYRSLSKEV